MNVEGKLLHFLTETWQVVLGTILCPYKVGTLSARITLYFDKNEHFQLDCLQGF